MHERRNRCSARSRVGILRVGVLIALLSGHASSSAGIRSRCCWLLLSLLMLPVSTPRPRVIVRIPSQRPILERCSCCTGRSTRARRAPPHQPGLPRPLPLPMRIPLSLTPLPLFRSRLYNLVVIHRLISVGDNRDIHRGSRLATTSPRPGGHRSLHRRRSESIEIQLLRLRATLPRINLIRVRRNKRRRYERLLVLVLMLGGLWLWLMVLRLIMLLLLLLLWTSFQRHPRKSRKSIERTVLVSRGRRRSADNPRRGTSSSSTSRSSHPRRETRIRDRQDHRAGPLAGQMRAERSASG